MKITIDQSNEYFNDLKYVVKGLVKGGKVEKYNILIVRDGKASSISPNGTMLKECNISSMNEGVYWLVRDTKKCIELETVPFTPPTQEEIDSVKDFETVEILELVEPSIDIIVYNLIKHTMLPVTISRVENCYTKNYIELRIGKHKASIITPETTATFKLNESW